MIFTRLSFLCRTAVIIKRNMFLYSCLVLVILFSQGNADFNPVAFTLGQNAHVDHVAAANNTDVPFNVMITTNGSPNLNSGRFVCSNDGLYKFQVYALTKSGANVFLEIYHNTQLVASLWGHTNSDYAAAGNAVVLPLRTGDTVEVKVRGHYEVHLYGDTSEIYTTFTGVQLGAAESLIEGSSLSAFSATLNQHEVVTSGSPVLYNNILTDVNQGYNQSTGIYTAPSGGLYLFHFFSLARQGQEEWQELFRNDQYVCSIYGKDSQEWADAGNSVLLHLNAGDQISIKSHNGRTSTLFGSTDEIYSTFSGVQIATDYDLATDVGSFGFSAGLTQHQLVHMDTNVVYDQVFYDDQGAYDRTTGTFTAPTSGLYEFNYHALGKQGVAIWLELFHNDQYINSLYSHIINNYATGGNAAVLDLLAGDRVSVRAHNNQALFGDPDEIYSTFTGYLLSKGSDVVVIGK